MGKQLQNFKPLAQVYKFATLSEKSITGSIIPYAIDHFIFQCISFKQERLRKGDKEKGERQFFNRL